MEVFLVYITLCKQLEDKMGEIPNEKSIYARYLGRYGIIICNLSTPVTSKIFYKNLSEKLLKKHFS